MRLEAKQGTDSKPGEKQKQKQANKRHHITTRAERGLVFIIYGYKSTHSLTGIYYHYHYK